MTYKKFFKPVNSVLPTSQKFISSTPGSVAGSRFNNWLPEVYSGPPDRLQRYSVYDQMISDHEISAALDTIADFGTSPDDVTGLPFIINYNDEPTSSETAIIQKTLSQWIRLNDLGRRAWSMFRSTLVYGDQFYIRDPETFQLYWIDPAKVEKITVNEGDGRRLEAVYVKEVDLNVHSLVATNQLNSRSAESMSSNSVVFAPPMPTAMFGTSYVGQGGSINKSQVSTVVDAEHIVQLSLTDGMSNSWPFGISILEKIYKVYKQKELLEDAVLIYRVHRAPERRVFFIDTGSLPPHRASQYLERIKFEVQQKRIPSRGANGQNVTDAVYSPMSMLEDYYFSVSCITLDTKIPLLDGRTLTLQECINEFESGKKNFAYSVNQQTHRLEAGEIVWGGITRKNAEIMEVILDNDEVIRCTPDHRFIMRDGSEVEAQYLKENDLLMPLGVDRTDINVIRTVKSVRLLDYREDTGDITINTPTGTHNFAVAAGVFIHNSEGKGSKVEVLPGGDNLGCFSLDTKVKLIDGRDLTILQIRQEIEYGGKLYTYSCHPTTGEIAPGLISGAGVTQHDAEVIRLELSNGEYIVCTPEHKFPIVGKGFVEAQNLDIGIQLNSRHGEPIYLVSITKLDERMSVGTLTVDVHEQFHNWHTYFLTCGVFVKNSIDDLKYFNNKMIRALGVPSSYLPTGPDDGTASVSDGKVGSAYIQEFRFSKTVSRYQQQMINTFDKEFKLFLKHRGITIDNSLFNLAFTEPQSFSDYRQLEIDSARINAFSALLDNKFMSRRFLARRYLGWTEQEIHENERMTKEERGSRRPRTQSAGGAAGLSQMGLTSSGIDQMDAGMDDFDLDDTEPTDQDIGETPPDQGPAGTEPGEPT